MLNWGSNPGFVTLCEPRHIVGEGEGGMNGETDIETYGWPVGICCMTQEAHRHTLLCDYLDGWEVGGRFRRGEMCVCLWLTHVDVWQKPAQYCRTAVLQLKIN